MKYEAIIYFDGPLSKWKQGSSEVGNPDDREVLQRKIFSWKSFAEGWAEGRINGLANVKFLVLPAVQNGPFSKTQDLVTAEQLEIMIKQGRK